MKGIDGNVQPCCGDCMYYDNGICDKTGYIVYSDEYPRCGNNDRDWSWVQDMSVVESGHTSRAS